jgi:hypothetical protein
MNNIEQDAVTTPAEPTVETESAPVEQETTDAQPSQEESPVEGNLPEKKVSESVPYDRFSEVNSEKQRLAEENAWLRSQQVQAPVEQTPELDPDSARAVNRMVEQKIEERRIREFIAKHGAELQKDPILDGTVQALMARERQAGRLFDHETVLSQAKEMLENRLKPAVKEASQTSFQEGQKIAQQKEQTSGVGNTNYKAPALDDKELSSVEFAKKHGYPII